MIQFDFKYAALLLLCAGLGVSSPVGAQTTDPVAAKDAYFSAQSLYDSGQYNDALAKLDEAKRLRGSTDAYFLALRARIQLGRKDYDKATLALMAFHEESPSVDLKAALQDVRIVADRELAKEIALWAEECEKNAGWACSNMGISYKFPAYGRYSTDSAIAAIFYKKGCDVGHGLGCTNLGFLYENGDGVEEDKAKARTLYQKGCENGNTLGCSNLGYLMQYGIGGAASYTSASEYYRKGCDGDSGRGCYNLGLLYRNAESTLGVDLQQASDLMVEGCRLGHRDACDQIDG